jgi:hypothetical protein
MWPLLFCAVLPGTPASDYAPADLDRFPDDAAVAQALMENEAVARLLQDFKVAKPWHKDEIEDLQRLNAELAYTWGVLRFARLYDRLPGNACYTSELHGRLGNDAFRQGRMPPGGLTYLIPERD